MATAADPVPPDVRPLKLQAEMAELGWALEMIVHGKRAALTRTKTVTTMAIAVSQDQERTKNAIRAVASTIIRPKKNATAKSSSPKNSKHSSMLASLFTGGGCCVSWRVVEVELCAAVLFLRFWDCVSWPGRD